MKSQLIEKMKNLLETDDISTIKKEARSVREDFKVAVAEDKQVQLEAWNQIEHAEGEDFIYVAPKEDELFAELIARYKERVGEFNKKIAEKQMLNLKAKKELLSALDSIVKNEQNIGKAFQGYKEFGEKWKSIGDVPEDQYQQISNQYQKLRDFFFYNIAIYKDLKEYDLKVNLKRKEELILKAKALLENETSGKECESMVKELQKEWNETGPSPKETYKEMGKVFFDSIRNIYKKIQKYRDELRSEMAKSIHTKREIINKTKKLVSEKLASHPNWIKKTDEVIALQEEWKAIGYINNKENIDIWHEFRGLCDLFFENKKQFYAARKEEYNTNKKKKEELIEKAKAIQNNNEWKETTAAFLNLQKEWKNAGSAFQNDEHKLWQKFRDACDTFFNNKKQHFQKNDLEQQENLKLKLKLMEEISAFEVTENATESIKALKEFSTKWDSIGFVPERNMPEVNSGFNKIMNKKFGALNENGKKNGTITYEQKIEIMKSAPNCDQLVEKEMGVLRKKMEVLRKVTNQYETNMAFFANSSGANVLKQEVEKKVKDTKIEMDEINKQLQLLKNISFSEQAVQ